MSVTLSKSTFFSHQEYYKFCVWWFLKYCQSLIKYPPVTKNWHSFWNKGSINEDINIQVNYTWRERRKCCSTKDCNPYLQRVWTWDSNSAGSSPLLLHMRSASVTEQKPLQLLTISSTEPSVSESKTPKLHTDDKASTVIASGTK